MNPKTTVYLSIAVLLGLAGVWYANSSKPVAGPPPGPRALFDPKPEGVKRFELAAWGKPAMVFEKRDGEKWRLLEPIQAPADKVTVEGAINRLLDAQVERAYADGETGRPGEDIIKMQQPTYLAKLTDKDGRSHAVRVGGPVLLARQTFVQVEGEKKLYVVKGELATEIQSGLETYRDKRVVDFVANDVVRLELGGATRMTLAKADGKWTLEAPVKARASGKDVTQMLVTLSNARAEKFIDDAPSNLRLYGLDKPRLSVTMNIEHEKKTDRPDPMKVLATQPAATIEKSVVTLHFGTLSDEKVFARLGDAERPWVFTLPKYMYDSVVGGAEKVRDKQVIAGDAQRATLVRVTGPGGGVSLEKKSGAWKSADGGDVDFAAVDDLLKGLAGLTATAFEDADALNPDFGFDAGTKIEMQVEGNLEAMAVTIGGVTRGGTGAYVRNDREGSVFVVKADAAEPLRVTPLAFVDRRLLSFERGHANRIEIEHDGKTVVLDKRGFAWEMTSPVSRPVETRVVTDVLADTSALAARNIVGTQADLGKFGLDQPLVRARITVQPPAPLPPPSTSSAPASAPAAAPPVTHSLIAGRHGGKAYLFVEGGTRIAEIDDKIVSDLTAEPAEHKVAKLDLSKISALELTYPDRALLLRKKGLEWLLEGEPGFRGDDAKVMAVANALRDLLTDRYVVYAGADLKTYGLDAPAIRVAVQVEGAAPAELRISSTGPAADEAKRRYATLGDSGSVFLIGGSEVAKFDKRLKDVQIIEGATPPPMPPPSLPPGMGE